MLKKRLTLLVIVLLIGALLVGCGGRSPVQTFLDEHGDRLAEDMEPLAAMMGEGARVALEAGSGNELIYVFAYGADAPLDEMVEPLTDMLDGMGLAFQMLAADMQEELELDSFRITVRYEDADGNVLVSRSFDA